MVKAGKVTAVLTSAGAIYGIWMGTKASKGFWNTAGMALLFSFAGAAIGTVYETVTTKDDEATTPPAKFSGGSMGKIPTGARHSANGTFGFASVSDNKPSGMRHSANGYMGSNIALRNRGK